MQLVFQKKGINVKFYPIYTSISFVCLFSDKLILFHMVFLFQLLKIIMALV